MRALGVVLFAAACASGPSHRLNFTSMQLALPDLPAGVAPANAIVRPDPDPSTIAITGPVGPLVSVTSFCVSPTGEPEDITTTQSSGNAELDRLCRENTAKFRFKPAHLDGQPTKMCTSLTYEFAGG